MEFEEFLNAYESVRLGELTKYGRTKLSEVYRLLASSGLTDKMDIDEATRYLTVFEIGRFLGNDEGARSPMSRGFG